MSSPLATQFGLKNKPVALIGHSESGSGAVRAARRVVDFEISDAVKEIAAVVGLAPSKPPAGSIQAGSYAKSLFIMQGTHDGDGNVFGAASLKSYEGSDGNASRHFCWIHGASHAGFLNGVLGDVPLDLNPDAKTRLSPLTQLLVAQNYVTMFLLWRMAGQSQFRSLFVGDAHVAFSSENKTVQDDLTHRFKAFFRYDAKTVLEMHKGATFFNFQQSGIPISPQFPAVFAPLTDRHITTQGQQTEGYIVQWNKSKAPFPTALFICDHTLMALNPKFIEFDAVLLGLSLLNFLSPESTVINIALVHTSGVSEFVKVSIPGSRWMLSTDPVNMNLTRSVPHTVRIPVHRFGLSSHLLAQTQYVALVFDVSNSTGEIVITAIRIAFA